MKHCDHTLARIRATPFAERSQVEIVRGISASTPSKRKADSKADSRANDMLVQLQRHVEGTLQEWWAACIGEFPVHADRPPV